MTAALLAGVLLTITSWPPQPLVAALTGAATITFTLVPAVYMLQGRNAHRRCLTLIAVAVLCTGGLLRSIHAYGAGDAAPVLWIAGPIVASLSIVAALSRPGERRVLLRYGLFTFYCALMCYLVGKLSSGGGAKSAGPAVGLADMAFDVLVFTVVQSRFAPVNVSDETVNDYEYWDRGDCERARRNGRGPANAFQPGTGNLIFEAVRDVTYFGVAVGICLMVLLATAAGPLKLNAGTVAPESRRLLVAVAVGALLLLGGATRVLSRRWRTARADDAFERVRRTDRLYLPRTYWIGPFLAALVWCLPVLAFSDGPPHLPLLATALAVVSGALYWKTFRDSATTLQTLDASVPQRLLSIAAALSIGGATFWFVSFGVWDGDRPLSGPWYAATAAAFYLGTAAVAYVVGETFASGLPTGWTWPGRSSERQVALRYEDASGFAAQDAVVFGLNVLLCVVVPLYAATREQALHAAPLNAIASMVFLPGFLVAVIWGLENWRTAQDIAERAPFAHDGGARRVPETLLRRVGSPWDRPVRTADWRRAALLDEQRISALGLHFLYLRVGVRLLMALGVGFLVWVLLNQA